MDTLKLKAAERALDYVKPGMRLGLGTGSTAAHFVALLGARVTSGLDVVCIPTSDATAALARNAGLMLTSLDETPFLDLTVDGADEIDGELRLIKGGGGALLREKIVAAASERLIIIADHTKFVPQLGAFPLPIEVVRFGVQATIEMVEQLAEEAGCVGSVTIRKTAGGQPFVTDNGNFILDCAFGAIDDPEQLDEALKLIPGVVENGLFLGLADVAIVAGPNGIEVLQSTYGAGTDAIETNE